MLSVSSAEVMADSASVAPQDGTAVHGVGNLTQADYPMHCVENKASTVPMDERVECKPKLYEFLGENTRMQGWNIADELRMDFVVRVPHGMVDPSCVSLGRAASARGIGDANKNCGMQVVFSRGGLPNTNLTVAHYLNTYGGDEDSSDTSGGQDAATDWALNNAQFFTIHNVMMAGSYDFLTISVEGDIAYGESTGINASPNNVGGLKFSPQYVYVAAFPGRAKNEADSISYSDFADPSYVANIAENSPAYMYDYRYGGTDGVTTVADANALLPKRSNGPLSLIGWDGTPSLWSGNQANWGLVTDYGFSGRATANPMVAPANSFFVQWYNVVSSNLYTAKDAQGNTVTRPWPCSRNYSFYYQWFGLKNGKEWYPVDALTPDVQQVNGQPKSTSNNGSDDYVAKNSPAKPFNLMLPNAGTSGSVMNADGSIDFGKAKAQQQFDGYFKLVTWPVTTTPTTSNFDGPQSYDGCIATDPPTGGSSASIRDAYNPLYSETDPSHHIHITDQTSQDEIKSVIEKGITIDTAFAKFSVKRPSKPIITSVDADSTGKYVNPNTRRITGTIPANEVNADCGTIASDGTRVKCNTVTVFRENPDKPVNTLHPDDPDTRGDYVGTTEVKPDGTWEIQDDTKLDSNRAKYVRYHAWQVDTSADKVSSKFSDLAEGELKVDVNVNPEITKLTVPHSIRSADGTTSALAKGAKVKIAGNFDSARGDNLLDVYVVPQVNGATAETKSALEKNAPIGAASTRVNSLSVPDQKWLISDCSGKPVSAATPDKPSTGTWSCDIDPTHFDGADFSDSSGHTYIWYQIYGVLNDSQHKQPPTVSMVNNQIIDMYPPTVTVDPVDRSSGFLTGKVIKPKVVDPRNPTRSHVWVQWPVGSPVKLTADDSGAWKISIPETMRAGNIVVTARDRTGDKEHVVNVGATGPVPIGNESVAVTAKLTGAPAAEQLPFTGSSHIRRTLAIVSFAAALALTLYLLERMWRQSLRDGSPHGPHEGRRSR
ncbi:hypothetical protein OZX57_08265 [Bifidobacterium sp. ESL0682]|uniref:hypothetical protein n=1 Tax=Bifidobacterium sp. ESL0682 TaxID=2983212 RepID=UPI0023F6D015|nr:hypothetical protein [Bifidobacterium sp. ESL0682]WEV41915.1 hypothetical protein OZX57_08265 [Bifidobacterium sp. ESL0682]